MRGHIEKRGKNSYSIVVSMGKDPNTYKYRYQWVTVKGTKKDAEKPSVNSYTSLITALSLSPGRLQSLSSSSAGC